MLFDKTGYEKIAMIVAFTPIKLQWVSRLLAGFDKKFGLQLVLQKFIGAALIN
jgi:hypothetical protein